MNGVLDIPTLDADRAAVPRQADRRADSVTKFRDIVENDQKT